MDAIVWFSMCNRPAAVAAQSSRSRVPVYRYVVQQKRLLMMMTLDLNLHHTQPRSKTFRLNEILLPCLGTRSIVSISAWHVCADNKEKAHSQYSICRGLAYDRPGLPSWLCCCCCYCCCSCWGLGCVCSGAKAVMIASTKVNMITPSLVTAHGSKRITMEPKRFESIAKLHSARCLEERQMS